MNSSWKQISVHSGISRVLLSAVETWDKGSKVPDAKDCLKYWWIVLVIGKKSWVNRCTKKKKQH